MGDALEYWQLIDILDGKYPYQFLHKKGWIWTKFTKAEPYICIFGNSTDMTKSMRNTIDTAMNERQMRVAKDICIKHGFNFHKAINPEMFW